MDTQPTLAARLGTTAVLLLPAGATVALSFSAGGFFPEATGLAALIVTSALLLRVLLVPTPFAGMTPTAAVVCGALTLLTSWTLASWLWSDAPARALLEFNRALLFLLSFTLLALFTRGDGRLERLIRWLALGISVVVACALISRTLPGVWPTTPEIGNGRLSYPLGYWNALGLLAALGAVLCLHLAASLREPGLVRVLGAAALPMLAAALLLTFSRGALLAAALGLLVYVLTARPSGLLGAVLAAGLPVALVVRLTYDAKLLVSPDYPQPGAVEQGHELILFVAGATAVAAALRAFFLLVDPWVERRVLAFRPRRAMVGVAAVLALGGLGAAALALDAPSRVEKAYTAFVDADPTIAPTTDVRTRLVNASGNGRLENWKVARDAWREAPVLGQGAGTYALEWNARRSSAFSVLDGHSLYLETMGELGLVGAALLLLALAAIVVGLLLRLRGGPDRSAHAAVLAIVLTWAFHAGLDWDWELPALTLPVLSAAGLALARPHPAAGRRGPGSTLRLLVGLGLVLCALTPALVALSQRSLDEAVVAFRRGDCSRTIDLALRSHRLVGVRPEPYELLAWCDVRLGYSQLGERMMRSAIARDPDNWELHYGLALVRGAAGRDPRPAARRALRLNPQNDLAQKAVRGFATEDRARWGRRARTARLPLSEAEG